MTTGVRITSNNLSGKTVNVTFLPVTGGTIDLGEKTIPFNNINQYPYGKYQFFLSEFNYTYELNVEEPLGINQNFSRLGTVSGDTTFKLGSLNFNDFTAEIINLDVDYTYWNVSSWYMITNYGYMITFRNWSANESLMLIINEKNDIIEHYSAVTLNYNNDVIDGNVCYFIDNTNGIAKFYNGEFVFDYTFDPLTEYMNIQWDWDGTTNDKTFIFTISNINNNKYSYKVSKNGSILPISNWDDTIENRYYGTYSTSNYFYEISYQLSDGTVNFVNIYDTDENIFQLSSISGGTYNNYQINWYGDKSFNVLLFSNSNLEIPYYNVNFDGNSQTITHTTHLRGENYRNYTIQYDGNFSPSSKNNGSIFMFFYGDTQNNNYYDGYEVNYCDIVYKLENSSVFNTYVFNDTGNFDKIISFNPTNQGFKTLYTFCSTGDTLSIIFINDDGVKIIPTNHINNDINGINYEEFGNYFTILIYKESYTIGHLILLNNGNIINEETFNTNNDFVWAFDYNVFYITDNEKSFYINEQVTGLTPTNSYKTTYEMYSFYTPNYYKREGVILLLNTNNNRCKVLKRDKFSNEFILPLSDNNWDIKVGRNRFLYVFKDFSNNTRINLYNFDGTLINSLSNSISNYEIFVGKDRYVVMQNDDNNILLTMLSDNNIKQISLKNDIINWWNFNDYILWD